MNFSEPPFGLGLCSTLSLRKRGFTRLDHSSLTRDDYLRMPDEGPPVLGPHAASFPVETGELPERLFARLHLQLMCLYLDRQQTRGIILMIAVSIGTALQVIFVTAYDDYAGRAFEVNALDYLLKRVSEERLAVAMDRCEDLHSPSRPPLSRRGIGTVSLSAVRV